jgi:DegV family protein with EDD domain
MLTVAIATDTTSGINREIAREFDIRLVPLYINMDGKSYPENEIDLAWFCRELPRWRQQNKVITTSAPSAGDFADAYRELGRKAKAVLAVCVSSKFSATFRSALAAKKIANDETPDVASEAFDTLTVCGAQMLIAIEASRAAMAGKSLDEVVSQASDTSRRMNCVSLSSDVSNLAKLGRIHEARSLAQSKVANTVLMEATMATGGEHKPLGRYATRKKAMEKIIEIVAERSGDVKLHVAINHADALPEAEELKNRVSAQFRCQEICICQSLPLVTYHEGLGNLKLSWWGE